MTEAQANELIHVVRELGLLMVILWFAGVWILHRSDR